MKTLIAWSPAVGQRIVSSLANLLMQAAGDPLEEGDDDRR
jgi:hypothetical protein